MPGKFELYKDVRKRFRFRLISNSGEKILTSDGYEQKAFVLDAIVSVMKNAPEAALIDLTLMESREIPLSSAPVLGGEELYNVTEYEYTTKKKKKKTKKANKGKKSKSDKKKRKGKKK